MAVEFEVCGLCGGRGGIRCGAAHPLLDLPLPPVALSPLLFSLLLAGLPIPPDIVVPQPFPLLPSAASFVSPVFVN